MRFSWLLALMLIPAIPAAEDAPSPAAAAPVLLAAVYYHAAFGDEAVTLVNSGTASVDIGGWYLSDGEGTVSLPPVHVIAPGERVVLTANATAYFTETVQLATYTWGDGNVTPVNTSGSFVLSNAGDALSVHDASGALADVLVWGDAAYSGPGWSDPVHLDTSRGEVLLRHDEDGWQDTNTSEDWSSLRQNMIGQSDFPADPIGFTGSVEVASSPGPSLEVLTRHIATASYSIRLAVYELRSTAVRDALLERYLQGVEVRVLLEGGPVGNISQRGWEIAGNLSAAGIPVRFLADPDGEGGIVPRYSFMHAKYLVIDDATALVSSENFGETGLPPPGLTGNRGWTVAVRDLGVASSLAAVFDADFDPRRLDSIAYADMAVTPSGDEPVPSRAYPYSVESLNFTGSFTVTPVIGPERSLAETTVIGLMRGATERLYIEQFYAHTTWNGGPNLYIEEALQAARRGVQVRILLDSSSYNVEPGDPNDNDDTVAAVSAVAAAESLPLEIKLADPVAHDVVKYHNKGVLVDGRRVLVSSLNWNLGSPTRNREVGLIIDHPGVGAYFEALFLHDWKGDVRAPVAVITPPGVVSPGSTFVLTGTDSGDDVGVVNWSWDLDSDGDFDSYGEFVSHTVVAPGGFTVRLVVSDAWGNIGETTRVIQVAVPPPPTDGTPPPGYPWLLLVLGAAGLALLLFLSLYYRLKRR